MDKQIFTVTVDKVVRYRQRVTIVAKSQREAEAIARDTASESDAETDSGSWRVVRKGDK